MPIAAKLFPPAALAVALTLNAGLRAAAQPGKNGPLAVSTANVVVNQYTALTADAAVGGNVLTVGSTTGLSVGDLVLIIQMQGAAINTTNTSSYGTITALNNAGNNELAFVASVGSATSLQVSRALTKSYTAAGKAQIVRIPRYTTVTVNAAGSIACTAWNGSTGGVVALEAQGATVIDGSVVATGLGFRGGAFANTAVSNNANYVGLGNTGGEKGESVAGYGSSYAGGSRGRGAPANGGGGGNSVNAGGGGGANCGAVASWTGTGNPSTATSAWNSAWALEAPSIAGSSSSGGGRGGYGVSDNNLDALTVGPNTSSWGMYNRPNTGGLGGRPLDYTSGRLYLGGGGGTGDGNTSLAGVGGVGGGLIYLTGPSFAGTGTVVANGAAGATSTATNDFADGAGGGGGGGAIVINASTSIGGITLRANGGAGGNTNNTVVKAYGPGGGGGAGYVGITPVATSGLVTEQLGGANGISSSPGLTEFVPNGATIGGGNTSVTRSLAPTPLPVTWVRFVATWEGNRTALSWATATELRSQQFIAERSSNGYLFTPFGEPVAAAGNSLAERRYAAYDATAPARQTVYYRVRQVDTDGTATYTPVVAVRTGDQPAVVVYPVPVQPGQPLRTTLPAGSPLVIFDLFGRRVLTATTVAADGTLEVDTRALAPGSYLFTTPGRPVQRLVVQE